ncbi:MAG: hypothetical protein A2X11_02565 [Bacteroidetes bacterium GWE2_42_24]|nr:MAG: hypothetical protein A2X11_02565 [Bacteroidetes bacterium GWE2_42_24]OFY32307.1 MAG: hypothetical protein A2X09_11770 [Bacteroidetes bacterium GWF2_43_11]
MKKIGIILQSSFCNKYLYKALEILSASDNVKIFFLINQEDAIHKGSLSRVQETTVNEHNKTRFFDTLVFKLIINIEYAILSFFDKSIKGLREKQSIQSLIKNEVTYLVPIHSASGQVVRYSDEEIDTIKKLELDVLIIGNGSENFEGEIFNCAKEGIVSIQHTDIRWNRGGLPVFWEVYFRYPSAGFVILRQTKKNDYSQILFRGDIAITSTYTKSLIKLYSRSYFYMAELILNFAKNGHLPLPEESLPFGGKLLRIPSIYHTFNYFLKTSFLLIYNAIERNVLKKETRWSVAFCSKSWRNSTLNEGIRIKNPPDHFFADPFVAKRNGRTVCFVEDFSFRQNNGCIAAIEILNEKEYRILGPIIEEPFHMSYPFVFEYKQDLYMIPETSGAKSIRLYKCIEFPLKWEYQKEILSGGHFVDPMILNHNGLWFILTNTEDEKLIAYYSHDPINGIWVEHEKDPLIFDLNTSRNGGLLRDEDGSYVRCRQKFGFNTYGAALTMAKIIDLSPNSYMEQEICQISPDFFPKLIGCHHMHSNGETTVFDYLRVENLK